MSIRDQLIDALRRERHGYLVQGKDDRAKAVTAQLAAMGAAVEVPEPEQAEAPEAEVSEDTSAKAATEKRGSSTRKR
jgi:hypothetical protein